MIVAWEADVGRWIIYRPGDNQVELICRRVVREDDSRTAGATCQASYLGLRFPSIKHCKPKRTDALRAISLDQGHIRSARLIAE
jgi:hypothetical protein